MIDESRDVLFVFHQVLYSYADSHAHYKMYNKIFDFLQITFTCSIPIPIFNLTGVMFLIHPVQYNLALRYVSDRKLIRFHADIL